MKFLYFLLIAASLMATEEAPWIEPVLTPVFTLKGGYQYFNHYRSGPHSICYRGRDLFLEGGLFFAPSPDLSLQLETLLTKTRKHGWIIDQVQQTACYSVLDDARGDPLAVTIGVAFIESVPVAIRDISFIHHAPFAVEFHTAFGKEWAIEEEWGSRLSGLAGCGFATRGSPWVRGAFAADHRLCLRHILGAKLAVEVGLGRDRLFSRHFRGYGTIAYRILDALLAYTYRGECGDFTLKYLRSLWRSNTPYPIQQFIIQFDRPFTL